MYEGINVETVRMSGRRKRIRLFKREVKPLYDILVKTSYSYLALV